MREDITGDLLVDDVKTEITQHNAFDEALALRELKHYLPAQASLKDFIHHNTLHAFQDLKFFQGIREASMILGYRVSFSLNEFRNLYSKKRIRKDVLEFVIQRKYGKEGLQTWLYKTLKHEYAHPPLPRIGKLRNHWKKIFRVDLDSRVHPLLFRILCSYLDQGIAIWSYPVHNIGFFDSLRELERVSFSSFFRGKRARQLMLETSCEIKDLLRIVVGDEGLYEHYLFDQQFAHQGWSGMVSAVESQPDTLLDRKLISIKDLIRFELLLEIDALDTHFNQFWPPLAIMVMEKPTPLFQHIPETEKHKVLAIWQEAFEWSYYDEVLAGLQANRGLFKIPDRISFQALFCLDDRECSFRRHLEKIDPACRTYGTPGFFSAEFFFQPLDGKFYTKVCPAPIIPKHLIKEVGITERRQTDMHFTKQTHTLFRGTLISQTLGFWSAVKLIFNIFRPTLSPATATSFKHMDKQAGLTIENRNPDEKENGLQIGFTIDEMVHRTENQLKSIGLVKDFAPIIYIIGHGSSSVNNPHYAAYDCGACSGRPGSVNSRVFCYMANHPAVRMQLAQLGITIPAETQFIGGLHDTTRDEIQFYDKDILTPQNFKLHLENKVVFTKALDINAKERSRRFESINSKQGPEKIHKMIKTRSVSLFEPRPELNHATNTLCIVGRRSLTQGLFLDRRAFLNSYDYSIDLDGKYLLGILRPAAPVCGGINLEYFFSRVDNHKLGAGTKLPHNVMGLIGVANGTDGDLRPGLPSQMIEVHDPIRLLMVVEHFPEVILETIQRSPETYEWFINDWIKLVAINPETCDLFVFDNGKFKPYHPLTKIADSVSDLTSLFENEQDNLPVLITK